jgi:pimeloyl-ACP methyl ester carboxylesterase
MPRRLRRTLLIVCPLLLFGNFTAVAFLTEATLHPSKHRGDIALLAHSVEQDTGAKARAVSITTTDGTLLKAWWLIPSSGATSAVIVCHGIADSAMGSLGFAPLFLRHGFSVLVPNSRGHGDSEGFVSFGVREADDIIQWLAWVRSQGVSTVYGLGESLGGAILLQSLDRGADFRAVVAESSYASFREIADDRIGQSIGPVLAGVVVREALLYARLRYHVDLSEAQPARSVATTKIPILLIHGAADNQTLPKHSEEIAKANPSIQLWLVPQAVHTGAYSAAPAEFEGRVLGWFHH